MTLTVAKVISFWCTTTLCVFYVLTSQAESGTTAANEAQVLSREIAYDSPPRVIGSNLTTRHMAGTLEATLQQLAHEALGPEWVGYSIVAVPHQRPVCRDTYGNRAARSGIESLETINSGPNFGPKQGTEDEPGLPDKAMVLFRIDSKVVTRIRIVNSTCTLDAGGLPVIWLSGVSAAESVSLLVKRIATTENAAGSNQAISRAALTAIALHADFSAERALGAFSAPDSSDSLRRQVAFWFGQARGASGLNELRKMAKTDPSPDVRVAVAFALSISPEAAAESEIIDMVHDDRSAKVRAQALLALVKRDSAQAIPMITTAIEDDVDMEVKTQAVFALNELPVDLALPRLVSLAQHNREIEVRKAAISALSRHTDELVLSTLLGVIDNDPDGAVKRQAVFALGDLPKEVATAQLIRLAQTHSISGVRLAAVFALAKIGGDQAADTIAGIVRTDQDPDVRRNAVSALGRLPRAQGVPRLITLARGDSNSEIRRQVRYALAQIGAAQIASSSNKSPSLGPEPDASKQLRLPPNALPSDELVRLMESVDSSRDPEARERAIVAIGQFEDPRSLEFIVKFVSKSENEE